MNRNLCWAVVFTVCGLFMAFSLVINTIAWGTGLWQPGDITGDQASLTATAQVFCLVLCIAITVRELREWRADRRKPEHAPEVVHRDF